jgi:hypothetical protein
MKKFSKIKLIIFGLALVFVGFSFPHEASAMTYSYSCTSGGNVTTVINFNPAGPYVVGQPFDISAYITSTCNSANVKLVMQNNNNPIETLIPAVDITNGGQQPPGSPVIAHLTAPTIQNTPGSNYNVRFVTTIIYDPMVYIKITPQGVSNWTTTSTNTLPPCHIQLQHSHTNSLLVEFFRDISATMPLDVTGMGFRLVLQPGQPALSSTPPLPIATPVISGFSYVVSPGPINDQYSLNMQGGVYQTWSYGCTWFPVWGGSGYDIAYNWLNNDPNWPSEATVPYLGNLPAPSPTIYANPSFGFAGDTTEIQWHSGAWGTTCTGTNFSTGGASYGTEVVTLPATPVTYTVSCTNVTGTGYASITVDPPPPEITFSAYPTSISQGQPTTLTWSAINATSCTGDGNFSTGGATSGSDMSYPNTTTSYTITCVGAGPESVKIVDVGVSVPCPEGQLCDPEQ